MTATQPRPYQSLGAVISLAWRRELSPRKPALRGRENWAEAPPASRWAPRAPPATCSSRSPPPALPRTYRCPLPLRSSGRGCGNSRSEWTLPAFLAGGHICGLWGGCGPQLVEGGVGREDSTLSLTESLSKSSLRFSRVYCLAQLRARTRWVAGPVNRRVSEAPVCPSSDQEGRGWS